MCTCAYTCVYGCVSAYVCINNIVYVLLVSIVYVLMHPNVLFKCYLCTVHVLMYACVHYCSCGHTFQCSVFMLLVYSTRTYVYLYSADMYT